ncbi:hypothetical protein OPW36_14145 [Vibrio europaeus]|uniref:hypothetical protein n=1 Tax=Vibrio europaeus TaxID=300876 RepID=UPI00233F145C|nr:hypothetical protein [Vibrio europaeus]MDC5804758.1 hypothetical protein [Vibrio europaeus]MDC5825852.1 hypothetical protein [Vibrio europaeus]MDC5829089.1 hypothetical protein [Vibrio europaeus]MDC5833558.1 hypothetical protein [Vibrio europaeus]MDC5853822.1 hypothetical protein [Vibrio europaeus]
MTDQQLLMFIEAFNQAVLFYVIIGVFVALAMYDSISWILLKAVGKLKPRREKELRSDDEAPSHSTD